MNKSATEAGALPDPPFNRTTHARRLLFGVFAGPKLCPTCQKDYKLAELPI